MSTSAIPTSSALPISTDAIEAAERDSFAPPAVLLMGGIGTGKTDCLATIIEAGLELFVVGTEPRYIESLIDSIKRRGLDISKLHYRTVEPIKVAFSSLIRTAQMVNSLSYEGLSQIKAGIEKDKYNQFVTFLQTLENFKCDRTGESFGPVDSWGSDRCLVIDSLSGINIMAKDLMLGSKPTAAQGEWGVAMDMEERIINKLCADTKCMFVLTAHTEREPDEITGGTRVSIGALGRKLAPKLPRFFSEVVLAHREGNIHYWSTTMTGYDLKKRVLPYSDKIDPTFKPIIEAWRKRRSAANA
jgi:hypothetical protein